MSNEDDQVWITYNGEIYNYRELQQRLERLGYRFRTRSDTEVILHAYEEWGERCVERFRGMFAFGIADFRKRRLFLARDHLGIKPLYYARTRTGFAFASELNALKTVEFLDFTLNMRAMDQYLWLQYIPAPDTIWLEVSKLPPAHCMSVTFAGAVAKPEAYWRLAFRPDNRLSKDEWAEGLDAVLRESVRAHMVSDVPFGAFLSGGVDSSAIVAYMAQLTDRPVRTFTIGFEDEEFSEAQFARVAARRWGTEHYEEIITPDALELLPRLVRHYGEPFGDSSAIPTFCVSQAARQFVPMVLSGDGGDEAFAGYDRYTQWMEEWSQREKLVRTRLGWKRHLLPLASRLLPRRYEAPGRLPAREWIQYLECLSRDVRMRLWRPEWRTAIYWPPETFERVLRVARRYGPSHMAQYIDIQVYLPFDILTKVDVASMMHGLEVRTPMADHKVMEFAATIPAHFNIGRDERGEWQGKRLLKEIIARWYPPDYLRRPKKGFSLPLKKWMGRKGAWREIVEARLTGMDSELHAYFDSAAIRRLLSQNFGGALWLLLVLEEWLRQNRGRAPRTSHVAQSIP